MLVEDEKKISDFLKKSLEAECFAVDVAEDGEEGFLHAHAPHQDKIALFEKSIDDISRFIYDLLKLTELESNNEHLRTDRIDLSTELTGLVEYFAISAAHSGMTVTSDIASGVTILGNTPKLKELLLSLLSNSEKYTKKAAEKRITITLHKDADHAVLSISDTGIGIPQEDLPHVFERFHRSHNAKRAGMQRSGLGLVIAKTIAEKHNATLTVTSTEHKGATFTLTFPCIVD